MYIRRLLGVLTVMGLSGCVTPYAVKRFQTYSGLKVSPQSSFEICRGSTRNVTDCKPTSGAQGWDKVLNLDVHVLSRGVDTSDVTIAGDISSHYLGAGYGTGGVTDFPCIQNPDVQRALDTWRRPGGSIQTTAITQAVEEEVIRDASAQFRGAMSSIPASPAARGKIEARFEAALRDSLRSTTNRQANMKWVAVHLQADDDQFRNVPGLQRCREFALQRDGSLITGVAGMVVMKNSAQGTYVTDSMFRRSAELALSAESVAVPSLAELAGAGARWSAETNRKINTSTVGSVSQPTFYPFWVQFSRVKP
jgi:hypothetical protein